MQQQRVVVHRSSGSLRLQVLLHGAQVVVNPEAGKPLAVVAARIAKKLQHQDASFLDADGLALEGDCTTLQTGNLLKIGEYTLHVFVNPPLVRDLVVPAYPMVGLPMMPTMALENTEEAAWRWLRGEQVVGHERFYVPTISDVGCRLVCECVPLPGGMQASAESDTVGIAQLVPLSSSPETCGDFRVLSYNLLADYNLRQDLARSDPDYAHLQPEERDFHYRRQLLLREIAGFSADILCMQEVDRDTMYGNFLQGQLGHLGYDGIYANKLHTSTPVGNAVFWRSASWQLITSEALDLTQGEPIQSLLEACPSLGFAMSKTTTVANLVVLEDKAGHRLVVANLHLFGDPGAPHIRLLQTYLVLCAAQKHAASLLVCGDFNCGSETGVCELLEVGLIDEEHPDWALGRAFQWGSLCDKRVEPASLPDEQWCAAMSLSHPFHLTSAGVPEYTYWNGHWGVVVDHLFVDAASLKVQCMLPVPPPAFVSEHGVASSAFPSDHAALVADLCWK
mmetsp:Transcript_90767/g.174210  ORF Transcript_90767/g.174210 Transcript_90767/m.174210 type:complete len:507 (-) Transcript_90767:107-1627(-)